MNTRLDRVDPPSASTDGDDAYRLKHEVFAARRALHGIRNAEVIARRGNISVQAVRKVLSGKQPNPQLRTLIGICQALDLKLEDVVDY